MPSNSPASEANDLCVACGLCCTGVLFTHIRIEPEEALQLNAAGHELEQDADRLRLRQPCPHHRDGCCSIYENRFRKCRSFRCALLKRLDAGRIGPAEAQKTVAQAKAMLESLAQDEPKAISARFRIDMRRGRPPPREAGARALGLWVRSLAFDTFLDAQFRNRPLIDAAAVARAPESGE